MIIENNAEKRVDEAEARLEEVLLSLEEDSEGDYDESKVLTSF